LRCYAVLASVSRCYPPLEGRLVTCYSPGRHFTHGLLHFLVRLACVRHAASVDSEPGSNSRLKPDVCRRVVGRLPSPRIQCSLQELLWFQQRGMAPPLSFAPSEEGLKTAVVYLVRSLGLLPESLSHDWHVQPSCQRPNRIPPKRREFSPGELARVQIRLSSKPYKHTVRRKTLSIDALHRISRCFPHREVCENAGLGELPATSRALLDRTAEGGCPHMCR
jgi:hypothetical protein